MFPFSSAMKLFNTTQFIFSLGEKENNGFDYVREEIRRCVLICPLGLEKFEVYIHKD